MIHVIATITVHSGCRAGFLDEFQRMAPLTRAEDGCIHYEPAIDCAERVHAVQVVERPGVVTIIERWRDLAALQAHLIAPHMADYRERVKPFVQGAQLQILRPAP